ncbi:MAG: M20/M25/M40 family metallo-hydrolase [Bacillota bacterium]
MIDLHLMQRLQEYFTAHHEDMIAENIAVCEVAAPPFQEHERAEYVARRWREIGLDNVYVDEVPNVYAEIVGDEPGQTLLVAAHLDTVFPAGTDVTVRRDGHFLHAPGVRDDSTAVAALIQLAAALKALNITPKGRIILVGTAGEEGLGDLRGMKAAMAKYGPEVDAVIAVDGNLSSVVHQGIASRRLQVNVSTGGGHSWGNFGDPNAIHVMGRMVADISHLEVPKEPRTSYNVGVISGGTSINTIAPNAEMLIDMRSTSTESLADLEGRLRAILTRHAEEGGVELKATVVGDRPGGAIPSDHYLVQTAREILTTLGVEPVSGPSSTDANVPLSQGIPAVCVGITAGRGAHRMDESLDVRPMPVGMTQLAMLIFTVASHVG